jgi:hypothetical protein
MSLRAEELELRESPELAVGRRIGKKGIRLCKKDFMCDLKLQ